MGIYHQTKLRASSATPHQIPESDQNAMPSAQLSELSHSVVSNSYRPHGLWPSSHMMSCLTHIASYFQRGQWLLKQKLMNYF